MRTAVLRVVLPLLTLGALAVPPAEAQRRLGFAGGEAERGLRPGVYYPPYDGAPFSHRYHYGTGSALFFGADPGYLTYMDYLDRYDRAVKFGYRIPPDPFRQHHAPCDCQPLPRGGVYVQPLAPVPLPAPELGIYPSDR